MGKKTKNNNKQNKEKKNKKNGMSPKQWTRIHSSELTNNLNTSICNHSAIGGGRGGEGEGSGSPLKCEDNHIGHFDIVPAEPWTFDFITELSHLLRKQTFKQSHPLQIFCCRPRGLCLPTHHNTLSQQTSLAAPEN